MKIAAAKRGRGRGAGAAAGGSRGGARGAGRGGGKGGGRGGGSGGGTQTLQTGKGTFVFQRVTDGLYIEHQWGKNSGHIGVAQESLAAFAKKIMSIAESSGAVSCRALGLRLPPLRVTTCCVARGRSRRPTSPRPRARRWAWPRRARASRRR